MKFIIIIISYTYNDYVYFKKDKIAPSTIKNHCYIIIPCSSNCLVEFDFNCTLFII